MFLWGWRLLGGGASNELNYQRCKALSKIRKEWHQFCAYVEMQLLAEFRQTLTLVYTEKVKFCVYGSVTSNLMDYLLRNVIFWVWVLNGCGVIDLKFLFMRAQLEKNEKEKTFQIIFWTFFVWWNVLKVI